MTETYVTKEQVQEMIVKAFEEYTKSLAEGMEDLGKKMKEQITEAINDSLENVVKYGEKVALKADQGQFICAEEGGPAEENQRFNLTSRSSTGPWESFEINPGQ